MNEEKRVVTIYANVDYDKSIDALKKLLEKFDAELKAANNDEYQILIAKSKLEDFCNELDLDIDDLSEEWDSYVPLDEEKKNDEMVHANAYMGQIDKQLVDFNSNDFFENARQNKKDISIRLQFDDTLYELYIDFEDKVYVEFWKIDFSELADEETRNANATMIYSKEFDENDLSSWKAASSAIEKFIDKKKVKAEEQPKHVQHHVKYDSFPDRGFSAQAAMLLDDAEEASSLEELNDVEYLAQAALDNNQLDKEEYDAIMRILATKQSRIDDSCAKDYEYDEKLANEIRDQILEGANADIPQHIEFAIESRGGEVESMRIAPYSIHVKWHLKDFTADNRIYFESLDTDANLLAEDIAHAIFKTSAKDVKVEDVCDSNDHKHTVNIASANMKDVAQLCDIFDDAEIKYILSNDSLTVFCGLQQWKELQNRFKLLRGE